MKKPAEIAKELVDGWHNGAGGYTLPNRMGRLVEAAIKERDDEWRVAIMNLDLGSPDVKAALAALLL